VREVDSDKALNLRADFLKRTVELIAPDIFPVEVSHAITKAERQSRFTPAEGAARFRAMLVALSVLVPYLPLLPRAYEISSKARIGVYDCLYVALAKREGCELITSDLRLINALQKDFPFITDLATMP
jgi:predicted nucleic acid-binding protein